MAEASLTPGKYLQSMHTASPHRRPVKGDQSPWVIRKQDGACTIERSPKAGAHCHSTTLRVEYRFVSHVCYIGAVNGAPDLTNITLGSSISPLTSTT